MMTHPNLALLLSICLLPLAAAPALAETAGVTAAVNQSASGTPPGGGVRTIVLGDNIVQDERIDTNADGLVQILLADGTTFTVGPNSSLSIDSFVYDPAANTAQVTASVTRGVFRFIGGRTSKTPDGVQITTPVGTVGIRGAVVDFSIQAAGSHFDLLFGKEVTFTSLQGLTQRAYQAGYSIFIGGNGAPGVMKTPPEWTSDIQKNLTSAPGQSGGSKSQPTSQQVAQSGVARNNSQLGAIATPPGGSTPPTTQQGIEQVTGIDTHDVAGDLTDDVVPPDPVFDGTYHGFAAAVVTVLDLNNNVYFQPAVSHNSNGVVVEFDPNAGTFGGTIGVVSPPLSGPLLDLTVAFGTADPGGTSMFQSSEIYYATGLSNTVVAHIDGVGEVTGSDGAGTIAAGIIDGTIEQFSLCTCDFMQWGVWISDVPTAGPAGSDVLGTWVTGDVTGQGAFDTYAEAQPAGTTATYNGTAIGIVTQSTPGWTTAIGDMTLTYDFGARDGEMAITDFDGRDFTGMDFAGGPGFSGMGDGYQVNGAFVTGGTDVAAGVIGDFILEDDAWLATGVFGGSR